MLEAGEKFEISKTDIRFILSQRALAFYLFFDAFFLPYIHYYICILHMNLFLGVGDRNHVSVAAASIRRIAS